MLLSLLAKSARRYLRPRGELAAVTGGFVPRRRAQLEFPRRAFGASTTGEVRLDRRCPGHARPAYAQTSCSSRQVISTYHCVVVRVELADRTRRREVRRPLRRCASAGVSVRGAGGAELRRSDGEVLNPSWVLLLHRSAAPGYDPSASGRRDRVCSRSRCGTLRPVVTLGRRSGRIVRRKREQRMSIGRRPSP